MRSLIDVLYSLDQYFQTLYFLCILASFPSMPPGNLWEGCFCFYSHQKCVCMDSSFWISHHCLKTFHRELGMISEEVHTSWWGKFIGKSLNLSQDVFAFKRQRECAHKNPRPPSDARWVAGSGWNGFRPWRSVGHLWSGFLETHFNARVERGLKHLAKNLCLLIWTILCS